MKCFHPTLISRGKSSYYVPCGRCAWCRKARRDDWFFRLSEEARCWPYTYFLTLTYSDEYLPVMMVDKFGVCRYSRGYDFVRDDAYVNDFVYMRDLQLYFKRVRKRMDKIQVHQRFWMKPSGQRYLKKCLPHLGYFAVSERGSKNGRVHFHAIVFSSCEFDFDQEWHYSKEPVIQLDASLGSFKYVTKYILKGSSEDCKMICSNGLGKSYLDNQDIRRSYYEDRKFYLPRYLRDKLDSMIDAEYMEYEREVGLIDSDAKHCSVVQSKKDSLMDDLLFRGAYDDLERYYVDVFGSLENFESWLQDAYSIDYKKQIKINRGRKC